MTEQLNRTVANVEFDGLVDAAYANHSVGVTVASGQGKLARGTVLSINDDGKAVICGTDRPAGYLECESTTPGALKVVASNPSDGQIAVASVTPVVDSSYTPTANDYVVYQEFKHFEARYILNKDIDATSADTVAIAYDQGRFIKQHLAVKTQYTLTAADIDSLRVHNICVADEL